MLTSEKLIPTIKLPLIFEKLCFVSGRRLVVAPRAVPGSAIPPLKASNDFLVIV